MLNWRQCSLLVSFSLINSAVSIVSGLHTRRMTDCITCLMALQPANIRTFWRATKKICIARDTEEIHSTTAAGYSSAPVRMHATNNKWALAWVRKCIYSTNQYIAQSQLALAYALSVISQAATSACHMIGWLTKRAPVLRSRGNNGKSMVYLLIYRALESIWHIDDFWLYFTCYGDVTFHGQPLPIATQPFRIYDEKSHDIR